MENGEWRMENGEWRMELTNLQFSIINSQSYLSVFESRPLKIELINVKIILKKKAVQKPSTLKPGTILSANKTIQALMTNKNNPSVRTVMGIVRRTKMGLKIAFKMDSTAATQRAEYTELI